MQVWRNDAFRFHTAILGAYAARRALRAGGRPEPVLTKSVPLMPQRIFAYARFSICPLRHSPIEAEDDVIVLLAIKALAALPATMATQPPGLLTENTNTFSIEMRPLSPSAICSRSGMDTEFRKTARSTIRSSDSVPSRTSSLSPLQTHEAHVAESKAAVGVQAKTCTPRTREHGGCRAIGVRRAVIAVSAVVN